MPSMFQSESPLEPCMTHITVSCFIRIVRWDSWPDISRYKCSTILRV